MGIRFLLPVIFTLLTVMLSFQNALSYQTHGSAFSSNITTVSSGGANLTSPDYSSLTSVSQSAIGNLSGSYDTGIGMMYLLGEAPSVNMHIRITKLVDPSVIVSRENETVTVNLTVKLDQTTNPVYMINTTDQIPWDFTPPSEQGVRVYFIDYTPYAVTDITGNATVNVSILDQSGSLPTLLMVNISNISQTDAGGYMHENDSIRIEYRMTSSRMEPGDNRTVYTNITLKDIDSHTHTNWLQSYVIASEMVLRGFKTLWFPDPDNPQNISGRVEVKAIGGPLSDIYVSDFLPAGAVISGLNVTYYNQTASAKYSLYNDSDYYLEDPFQDTLPDGTYADVYFYNFSYNFTNWDGNLYDNDSITITYNATVLGGGQWILPALLGGYDPTYRKHIKTETSSAVSVPLFDVVVEVLKRVVEPGEAVKAVLRMLNVGGPKARVDVMVTYSAKTMQGSPVAEESKTFAVESGKEESLELWLPPTTSPGTYLFEALVTYAGREALSTSIFEVSGPAGEGYPGAVLYVIAGLLLLIAVLLAFLLKRK